MKRTLLALLCALIILPLTAQNNAFKLTPQSPSTIFRLSLVSPKLIAEFAPSDNFTVITGFWIRTSFWHANSSGEVAYAPHFSPSFTIEPRYYFNLEDRQEKGKRTDYYSGWFIGIPFNIEFPDFKGKIHISYKKIDNNLTAYLEDSRTMAMKHIPKASSIENKQYEDPVKNVYGLTYDISGTEAASPFQFYLTDSTNHFVRGALYFNTIPNNDSLAPVIDFIKQDIQHLIETFEWR